MGSLQEEDGGACRRRGEGVAQSPQKLQELFCCSSVYRPRHVTARCCRRGWGVRLHRQVCSPDVHRWSEGTVALGSAMGDGAGCYPRGKPPKSHEAKKQVTCAYLI